MKILKRSADDNASIFQWFWQTQKCHQSIILLDYRIIIGAEWLWWKLLQCLHLTQANQPYGNNDNKHKPNNILRLLVCVCGCGA